MNFEPGQRYERWLFLRKRDARPFPWKADQMQRLRYNLVEYDGVPEGLIEPAPPSDFYGVTGASIETVVQSETNSTGRVSGFEIFDAPPFDGVHAF